MDKPDVRPLAEDVLTFASEKWRSLGSMPTDENEFEGRHIESGQSIIVFWSQSEQAVVHEDEHDGWIFYPIDAWRPLTPERRVELEDKERAP